MKRFISQSFQQILIQDFNLCFFISLCLLSIYPSAEHLQLSPHESLWFIYIIIPTFNGFFTGFVIQILNNYFARKNYTHPYYTEDKTKLFFIAFCAGFLSIYISISSISTYLISLLIIYIAILNVRSFASKLSALLQPDKMASIQDLGFFANFFINLIITFAVINLTINTIHGDLGLHKAFNFGQGLSAIIDAVYFSVITMTTVGYGDIIPHTVLARFVVSFECLTSYIMLGIMIGIITRGIKFDNN